MEICKKSKKKRKNIHRAEDLTPSDAPGGIGKSPGDFLSRSKAPGWYTNA